MKFTHSLFYFFTLCGTASLAHAASLDMKPIATLPLPGAEIPAFDPLSDRLAVNSNGGLQLINLSNPSAPSIITTIDFTLPANGGLPGTDVTSVAIKNGIAAVSILHPTKPNNGYVVFLNMATGAFISSVEVGAHPDNIVFSADGTKVITANEGELSEANASVPNSTLTTITDDASLGSVSIINVSGGFASPSVTTVGFSSFDAPATVANMKSAGVRIFAGGKPSTDFEPEYVAISPDSTKAMVTLQEANAVALLDLVSATFTSILPLGEKDFSTLLADFSDRDGPANTTAIRLSKGNPVFGLYMPDAIASYSVSGQTYYVMSNEGDDRDDFLNPDETIRVGSSSYVLDPAVFPNAADLKSNARLGRLIVSNGPGLRGDTDGDGDVDRILTYGARSFSIRDATGALVYDSADLIERGIASFGAPWFDDTRSDNKSSEPEGVAIGSIGGKIYAFIGLERSRGVMAFDVTNPLAVEPAGFATVSTDLNPEGLVFIPAADSPNGKNLLAVANETSNTLTLFTVQPADFSLQVLHVSDAEAGLLAAQTAPNLAALVDAFDNAHPNTLILNGGDSFLPGPFLSAGADPALNPVLRAEYSNNFIVTAAARPDIAIHNILGIEASAIGNHEFDLGSNVFSDAIRPAVSGPNTTWVGALYPHLTTNIDFTADPLNSAFDNVTLDGLSTAIPAASTRNGRIVPTATVTKGGVKIGLVGVTTQILETISSPSGARIRGFATPRTGVDNMDLLATQVQPFINELTAEGVDKIILLSHLQQISNEQLLATKLSGVDIILAAGSNTRLGDADDVPVAFPGHAANFANTYPIRTAGTDGKPTLIINTDNEFTYLGRLIVDFDANGEIIVPNLATRSSQNGAYAATSANVATAWGVAEANLPTTAFAVGTKGARVKAITDGVQAVIAAKDGNVFGFTQVYLEGERIFVRNQETNLGNITADANAAALRRALSATTEPIVSIKNGGGIRAQIGAITAGSAEKLPPLANPSAGKPAGAISQLDVENALRFNNRLMSFQTNPSGLKAILEHSVAALVNQGRFPQIGGVAFAFDPARPANDRILSISLIDANDQVAAAIYQNGQFIPNAPASIQVVTLNFLANGGDGYPIKANGDNFQFILNDFTLTAPVAETENYGTAPTNALGEIAAMQSYLQARYPTAALAYKVADTPQSADLRIQRIDTRTNTVLPFDLGQMTTINTFTTAFLAQGISPSLVATAPTMVAAVAANRNLGRNDVINNPSGYNLFSAPSFRIDGSVFEATASATFEFTLQSSSDLLLWENEAKVRGVQVDLSTPKRFFRFTASTP